MELKAQAAQISLILETYLIPKSICFGPRQALDFQARLSYDLESNTHKTYKGITASKYN